MVYDTANSLDARKLELRIKKVIERKQVVKVEVPRLEDPTKEEDESDRTIDQNSYLHLILQYFATQCGQKLKWVKLYYYKMECNREIYVREQYDDKLKRNVKYVRSSKDLSVEEMSTSIERFKNWSVEVAEIILPDAKSKEELRQARIEINKVKAYL